MPRKLRDLVIGKEDLPDPWKQRVCWFHLLMQHWPERVQAKCRTDKSLAIAHDRLDLYEGAR